ncbi:phosphoserine aminotransferase [Atractiella rhizophila]|nr:phosphoserine aminotransferase [Atractiella rhizophila]
MEGEQIDEPLLQREPLTRRSKTINLNSGPCPIPTEVITASIPSLLDFAQTGIGILEISHRSKEFDKIIKEATDDLRTILKVPSNFKILWMQGGGTGQFGAVCMNLMSWYKMKYNETKEDVEPLVADFCITGAWSSKSAQEAKRLGFKVNVVCSGESNGFSTIPPTDEWRFSSPDDAQKPPAFVYMCDNETIQGLEYSPSFPFDKLPYSTKEVPLVSDMSSNILTRKIDWSKFGIIFAGAQKNIGPTGVTVVFVREDLIVNPDAAVAHGAQPIPSAMSYHLHSRTQSLHNTPPVFSIYICGLFLKHVLAKGGLEYYEQLCSQKFHKLYDVIDNSEGFYIPTIKKGEQRSRLNICFTIKGGGRRERRVGLKQIKGHRDVGGIRISSYNAVTLEQIQVCCGFMVDFQRRELEIEKYA